MTSSSQASPVPWRRRDGISDMTRPDKPAAWASHDAHSDLEPERSLNFLFPRRNMERTARARHGVYGATSAPVQGPVPPRRVRERGGVRVSEG